VLASKLEENTEMMQFEKKKISKENKNDP